MAETISDSTAGMGTVDSGYNWAGGEDASVAGDGVKGYGPLQVSASGQFDNYLRHNTKNFDNFKYFLEGIDVTDQNLDQMTPFIPGIVRLYFHKTPYFMEKKFPRLSDNFRSYIETGFKEISGIQNLQAEPLTIEGGWNNQSFENISSVKDDTNEITITLIEQTGSPVREYIEGWMTGMRDPRSRVAHYHGCVKNPDGKASDGSSEAVTYCEKNHTGEFIYVVLDPTAQFIEYACLLAHAWPKVGPREHLNFSPGNSQAAEMQLQFSCMKYEGKYVNDIAAYYISKSNLIYNYLEFNPYRPDTGAYDTLESIQNAGNGDLESYMKKTSHHAGTAGATGF